MVDLRPDQLATVNAILLAEVPEYEIWAFGSRAQWTAKDSSDLDLAIVSERPLPFSRISHLREAFEESYLPFTVDVVDLAKASSDFRAVIAKQHVVFRKAEGGAIVKEADLTERRSVVLEDAVETIIDYRGKTPKKVDAGIPLITAKIIKNGKIETPTEFISTVDYDEWMRRGLPQSGDVLLTTEAPLGEVAQLDMAKVALAQRVVALRGKKNLLNNDFLKYLMQSREVQDQLKARASGTTVLGIKQSELRKISITLPPLNEQRAIAQVLNALDEKIALNRRMNETLEAMAQALFEHYFVQLNDGGPLSAWAILPLAELSDVITKGTTPTRRDIMSAPDTGRQINYVRANAIAEDGSILREKLIRIPESLHEGVLKRSKLKAGDVLYTIAGTIGRMSVVEEDLLPANCNQAIAIIRPKLGVPPEFLLLSMQQPFFQEELHSNIVHAVQANLSLGMISKAELTIPPLNLLGQLFRPIESMFQKIGANHSESRTLGALRDSLLPRLLAGQLCLLSKTS